MIRAYEARFNATLIVVIDAIFAANVTLLEELLFDIDGTGPVHLMIAAPGGDGETAIRMVRSIQARCTELTMIVPDLAKSAATLLCLGADKILMGPAGDLGPVDSQFLLDGKQGFIGAKEIVSAVEKAEAAVKSAPDTVGLYAALLESVDMLIVEQARSAMARDVLLVQEALSCAHGRTAKDIKNLAEKLKKPLIQEAKAHESVFSSEDAKRLGLPVVAADPRSEQWQLIWSLWTRYFALGWFPAGQVFVYEGRKASLVAGPPFA